MTPRSTPIPSFFLFFFFLMNRRPPRSPLFPYPTLFRSLLTTNSQWFTAIERNGLPPSLWLRQTRSTKGESDALSSSTIIMLVLPSDMEASGLTSLQATEIGRAHV